MVRRILAVVALASLLAPTLAAAEVEKYVVDPTHSQLEFTVRHFVSKVPGRFDKFEGEIRLDPNQPETMSISGKADAGSIDTNAQKRDEHLRSSDFFDVQNHPELTFKSKKVTKAGANWTVGGDLTMRGVTKEVTLEVEILGVAPDAWGNMRAGFEAKGRVNRKDFGITWNKVLDSGGTMLSDDVDLTLQIEAVKEKPEPPKK